MLRFIVISTIGTEYHAHNFELDRCVSGTQRTIASFACKADKTELFMILFVSCHYWAEVSERICFGKVNPGAFLHVFCRL